MPSLGWRLSDWWKKTHIHRHVRFSIDRYGDITRTCLDCGDELTIQNPNASRP